MKKFFQILVVLGFGLLFFSAAASDAELFSFSVLVGNCVIGFAAIAVGLIGRGRQKARRKISRGPVKRLALSHRRSAA